MILAYLSANDSGFDETRRQTIAFSNTYTLYICAARRPSCISVRALSVGFFFSPSVGERLWRALRRRIQIRMKDEAFFCRLSRAASTICCCRFLFFAAVGLPIVWEGSPSTTVVKRVNRKVRRQKDVRAPTRGSHASPNNTGFVFVFVAYTNAILSARPCQEYAKQ